MSKTFNKQWLMERYPDAATIPFLFFYGHQPSKDGSIAKSCFSQWWVAPFEVDGVRYPTAEHWMMAGKAKLFGDPGALARITATASPSVAKKEGRLVQNFIPDTWNRYKYELVVVGNWHKFSQNDELKRFLLETGDQVLVEASPLDRVWGIGLGADKPAARNPQTWKGENLLGFALMEVREKLRV
jgi:ribA/ribD-fused uncharacterized protein